MNLLRTGLVLLLPLMAACGELQTLRDNMVHPGDNTAVEDVSTPVIDGNRGVHSWLADMQALRLLPPEALPAELDTREKAFRIKPDDVRRMQLVMLLLLEDESVQDGKRARQLLRGFEPLPPGPGEREFIRLLKQFLDGQKGYDQKMSVLWKQVTQQSRRIDELEQQLKALTSIEQTIQQREPPPVKENGK